MVVLFLMVATSPISFDVDLDLDLDLYVANYVKQMTQHQATYCVVIKQPAADVLLVITPEASQENHVVVHTLIFP